MFLEKGEYAEPIESVNIIIENSGNSDIYFGTPYAVEKYVDGQWFKVPFKDNVSSTSIGLHLKTGQTYTQKIILSLLDYEVNHGKYRIIKDFNTNDNVTVERIRITLAAEFEIKR